MDIKKTITATGDLASQLELEVKREDESVLLLVTEVKLGLFDLRPVVLPAQTGYDGLEHGYVVQVFDHDEVAGKSDADIVDEWFNSPYGVS